MRFKQKKSLGQVFLKDNNSAKKIVENIDNTACDTILEIGPGKGNVTRLLLDRFKKIHAVEIDRQLVEYLEKKFENNNNLNIIHDDYLRFDIGSIVEKGEKINITGNLPYYISSTILFKLFDECQFINEAVIMFQKEVARRIVSTKKDKGITSILTRFYGVPELLFEIKRELFKPVPDVDSALVKITFHPEERKGLEFSQAFFRTMVKTVFGKRRKMLRNSLKDMGGLNIKHIERKFDLDRRPEELSLEDFIKLGNVITKYGAAKN